jgi:thymidylate synthase (FAD)
MDTIIHIAPHGYVRHVDTLGTDLSVVNAARASYMKESREFSEGDEKLIKYLALHGHTSPFRHAAMTFEIKAPLMVARQWFKYRVGSAHSEPGEEDSSDSLYARNEASRRYVTMPPQFYVPLEWRLAPASSKAGSGGPAPTRESARQEALLTSHVVRSVLLYEEALDAGICAEQARLFLPAYALYTTWRWTGSLHAIAHFLNQRLSDDAQHEIRDYARVVHSLVKRAFPKSIGWLVIESGL